MRSFKSVQQAQRFLSIFGPIHNLFRVIVSKRSTIDC
jgi:hypothetical protein